jgi:hypothetical protein
MTYRRDSDIPNPYGRVVSRANVSEYVRQLIGHNIPSMEDDMQRENFSAFRPR